MEGAPATAYPEAVNMGVCSGVVITPSIVMTASHCLGKSTGVHDGDWNITAPNAGGQSAHGSMAWSVGDAEKHSDVGLVFLDTPIMLDCYPPIASSEVPFPATVVDIGHTSNGSITTDLWVSAPIELVGTGDAYGLPDHYTASQDLTEDGDSGGPIELLDGTHTVVALVSTDTAEAGIDAAPPIDLLARVDSQFAAIDTQVRAHGGYGMVACGAPVMTTNDAGTVDNGDASPTPLDASAPSDAAPTASSAPSSSSGCAISTRPDKHFAWLFVIAIVTLFRKRSPRAQ